MIQNDRVFYRVLLLCLLACLTLYAEETLHFLHYGWTNPDNSRNTRDLTQCKPVPGKPTDMECPVAGYGWFRYRQVAPRKPDANNIMPIDRIE